MRLPFGSWRRTGAPAAWEYCLIAIGCFVMALGFRLFANANGIVAGGVVGLSTVLQRGLGWEPSWVQAAINLPLLVVGWLVLGKAEGIRSLLGSILLPVAMLSTKGMAPITHDPYMAALFGGSIYGVGLALILTARGSVGGYSLIGRMAAKKLPVSVTSAMLLLDAATILAGGYVFGTEKALLGLVAAFVMRAAIERTLVGFGRSLVAMIISERHEEIRQRVLRDLDRGLTVLAGRGGYTDDPRPVLMVVCGQAEVPALRSLVGSTDPKAFVILMSASEVLGQGFGRSLG